MSSHWNQDKICQPISLEETTYHVAKCQQLGRYLVSARDLRKGEIILQEFPISAAPQKNSTLICPGCFGTPNVQCQKCSWPICGVDCPQSERHLVECEALCKLDDNAIIDTNKNHERSTQDWISLQDTLMIFRCLSLKSSNKEKWDALLQMETNWEQWSNSPLYSNAEETLQNIRDLYGISEEEFSRNEILQILAIFDINAYEVKMPDVNVQGCYQLASLAEHSCIPNAFKVTSSSSLLLTMRALTDIPKGSHIATTYCDVLWPTSQRQKHTQWSKFFTCHCARCTDSTELGSYISSICCPICPIHCISPLVPILQPFLQTDTIKEEDEEEEEEEEELWKNPYKDYQCQKCGNIFPANRCESFMISAEQHLQELENKECSMESKNIEDFENWLEQWTVYPAAKNPLTESYSSHTNTTTSTKEVSTERKRNKKVKYSAASLVYLHPQHALSLDACHTAFLLYSSESLFMDELNRKSLLGMHLLQATANIFRGGISMFRGTIMYELAMTKAAIFGRSLESTEEDESPICDLKTLANEILCLLTEALDNLQYESEDQPEGKLFTLGLKQLEDFKNFLKDIIPDLLNT